MIELVVTVLFIGSAFLGALISCLWEWLYVRKHHGTSMDFDSALKLASTPYILVYAIGFASIAHWNLLNSEEMWGLAFGTFPLLLAGILPLFFFAYILTRVVAWFTGYNYKNSGGPSYGL